MATPVTDRSCILHIGRPSKEQVKPFDEKTWQKVTATKEKRMTKYSTDSKYTTVCKEIPTQFEDSIGYHTSCYKNFTAISQTTKLDAKSLSSPSEATAGKLLRSQIKHQETTTSGIFQSNCIFCGHQRKTVNHKLQNVGNCETRVAEEAIKKAALLQNDTVLLTKIADIDFIAKEVKYHHACRKAYLNKAQRTQEKECEKSDLQEARETHQKAFGYLADYVKLNILENNRPEFITSIHIHYTAILNDQGHLNTDYPVRSLTEKIKNHFGEDIAITKSSNKQGNVLYKAGLDPKEAVKSAQQYASTFEFKITDAALHIRAIIQHLWATTSDLPSPVTVEALTEGQVQPPDVLLQFFRVLYTGSEKESGKPNVERYVQSSAQDAIFATTRGYLKPAKHICLGLGMKSMTGSRKVLEILNHFGHSIGYHIAEELETELAITVTNKDRVTPDGLLQEPGLATGVAWDNYDENAETLSGSGTLHDTVGISIQNLPSQVQHETEEQAQPTLEAATCTVKKRKRSFNPPESEIEPYRKKPKFKTFQYDVRQSEVPKDLINLKRQDNLWMMSTVFHENTPMWIGWNSRLTEDDLPQQTIGYMDNLNLPPTRLDVVAETMKISQKLAAECGEQYAIVHYDLAVAKLALSIQAEESPTFDNVFVCFGAFHLQMAFHSALCHYLADSGGPQILTDTGVLAPGSLNGFISGKHYNRCKRLHTLLGLAVQSLHFQQFLDEHGPLPEDFMQNLQKLHEDPSAEALKTFENTRDYDEVMQKYEEYTDQG